MPELSTSRWALIGDKWYLIKTSNDSIIVIYDDEYDEIEVDIDDVDDWRECVG